ncbi:MAG TPA: DUF1631 family protein [Albitalea sp.]
MPLTAQLQRFVEDELSRAAALAEETVSLTLAQLQQPRAGMLSVPEREHYHALVQDLPLHAAEFVRGFATTLRRVVMADMQGHDEGAAPSAPRGLELMDESRVEVDIEIAGAAQLISTSADWELRELQTFTSTLAGHKHVIAETNPLRPLAYARALWEAAGCVTGVPAQRSIVLRLAAGVMSGQLKKAWAAASTRLESQGVEPGIYRTVVLAPGPTVHRPPAVDLTQPGALEGLLPRMPAGDGRGAPGTPRARSVSGLGPDFEQALGRIDALLQRASSTPGGSAPATPQLREHRANLLASTAEPLDRQIIELLSRLFEAVLADLRLPPAFRAVLARLQVSALRVALVDEAMLDTHEHPVWRLMNRIGSAAETYTQTTDPRWAALLAYCETLVEEMAHAPVQDALLYKRSLSRLDAFLGEQLREQQQRVQPTTETLARLEQREEMAQQLSQRLVEQMASMRIAAGLRRFVTGSWAKVLAEAMQRHGDQGEATRDYLKATDDLLWSMHPPDHPKSRQRLLAMLPGLLQNLRSGMALIDTPLAEQQAVLDELMAVHTEALRPGAKSGSSEPALTSEQIVQRMREESAWAPPSRPPFSESLIDLSSMETVPADLLPVAQGSADDAAQRVESLQVGSRHHLFLHSRWTRVQLLWRSPRGQSFVFAGANPGHPHSITRRALLRLAQEGLLKPLDDVSLVQRAVDSLVRKLG